VEVDAALDQPCVRARLPIAMIAKIVVVQRLG